MLSRVGALAPRMGRLSVFLLAVAFGLYLLLGRAVEAQVERSLLELGAGIAQLETGAKKGDGGPRVLELNGASIRVEVESRDQGVDEVLSQAEKACSPGKGRDLRGSDGARGFVACFVAPAIPGPVIGETKVRRPAYRYVYAQPGEDGTLVVSLATDGSVKLEELFPPEGDAPGLDAPGLPRPPESRRVLSAREPDAPQQMTLYMAPESDPAELVSWYQARLPELGWRPLHAAAEPERPRALVVERGGELAVLVVDEDQAGGASVAILTSL